MRCSMNPPDFVGSEAVLEEESEWKRFEKSDPLFSEFSAGFEPSEARNLPFSRGLEFSLTETPLESGSFFLFSSE